MAAITLGAIGTVATAAAATSAVTGTAATALAIGGAAAAAGGAYLSSKEREKAAKEGRELQLDAQGRALRAVNEPLAIPEVAPVTLKSPDQITGEFRSSLSNNLPGFTQIADDVAEGDVNRRLTSFNQVNPQFSEESQQLSDNALSFARGELPQDVVDNVYQRANEDSFLRGFSSGREGGGGNTFAGSNAAGANLALRNLGLTSLDLSRFGTTQALPTSLAQSRATAGNIAGVQDFLPSFGQFAAQDNLRETALQDAAQQELNREAGVENAPRQANLQSLILGQQLAAGQASADAANRRANTAALESTAGAILKGVELYSSSQGARQTTSIPQQNGQAAAYTGTQFTSPQVNATGSAALSSVNLGSTTASSFNNSNFQASGTGNLAGVI